jgi:hypothetical protein
VGIFAAVGREGSGSESKGKCLRARRFSRAWLNLKSKGDKGKTHNLTNWGLD